MVLDGSNPGPLPAQINKSGINQVRSMVSPLIPANPEMVLCAERRGRISIQLSP
jgi:hypothetical protein